MAVDDYYRSGSGIYIKPQDHILRIQRRNTDGCSVFRSELIAIDEALGYPAFLPNGKDIWILSNSRSEIQHLSNWQNLEGIEIVDTLAARYQSSQHPSPFLRFSLELNTRIRPLELSPPPEHHWYQCSRSGGTLAYDFKRQDQTFLARFRSGHLKTMKYSEGCKSFEVYTNCSSEHPRKPRAHQAGFRRGSLAGVGVFESVRSHGPGLPLLTHGGGFNNNNNNIE
ncbi:uncharacterized protein TNCV_4615491 [Trichonephila clavipes]|nr:uncharacterized protein TNCV_4615491 [Trichonephila clavipes]